MLGLGLSLTTFRGGGSVSTVGASFDQIVTLPYAWQMAFFTSFLTPLQAARDSNVGTARTTTYYFDSENGSYGNSGLSADDAFSGTDNLADILAGNPNDIRCRFRRGQTFGMNANSGFVFRSHTTFDDFGDEGDADPIITAFDFWASASGAGGWTSIGSGVYWKSTGGAGTEPTWVRLKTGSADGTGTLLTRASDTTALALLANGFYIDTTNHRVYMRLGSGATDPNTVNLDGNRGYNGYAIELFGTDIRMQNIELHGLGMKPNGTSLPTFTVVASPQSATDEIYVKNVKALFNGYHSFASLKSGTSSGIVTFEDCSAGYIRLHSDAGTGGGDNLVFYSENGGGECIVKNFTSLAGNLFDQTPGGATTRVAGSIFAHCVNGTPKLGLFIVDGHTIVAGPMSCRIATDINNSNFAAAVVTPYDWTHADWLKKRCFIIDETYDDNTRPITVNRCINNAVRMNSFGQTIAKNATPNNGVGYRGTGVDINCFTSSAGTPGLYVSMGSPVADGGWEINPHICLDGGGDVFLAGSDAADYANAAITSGIIECIYGNHAGTPQYDFTSNMNVSIASNKVRYCLLHMSNPTTDNALLIPNGTAGDGNRSSMTGNTFVAPTGSRIFTPFAAATGALVGTGDPSSQLQFDKNRQLRSGYDRGPVKA